MLDPPMGSLKSQLVDRDITRGKRELVHTRHSDWPHRPRAEFVSKVDNLKISNDVDKLLVWLTRESQNIPSCKWIRDDQSWIHRGFLLCKRTKKGWPVI